jgi:hypothetical protein
MMIIAVTRQLEIYCPFYVDHDGNMRGYNNEGVVEVPSPHQNRFNWRSEENSPLTCRPS